MSYTTDDLINSIKKRGLVPTSQRTVQQDDFNRFMDEELTNGIVPKVMQVRENYFLKSYDQTVVSGTSTYAIHTRAIGMKFKNVYFVGTNPATPQRLTQIDVDKLPEIGDPTSYTGNPFSFYFTDNDFVVVPVPSTGVTGVLRQWYYQRRNTLVSVSACGKVTGINGNVVTVNQVPTTFSTTSLFDFVKATPGFQNLAIDQAISGISGSDITFSSAIPATLALGDYVCLAGQSCVPQIMPEAYPVLSQRTVIRCLRAINDLAGSDRAMADLAAMEEALISQITIRAEDQPKKMVSTNNISNYVWSTNSRW